MNVFVRPLMHESGGVRFDVIHCSAEYLEECDEVGGRECRTLEAIYVARSG